MAHDCWHAMLPAVGKMPARKCLPNAAAVRTVAEVLASVREPRTMARLLEELLTPAERHDLALRWRLLGCLRRGDTQRRIATDLGISLCKITRGSRILKQPGSVSARLLASRAGKE